MAKTRNRVVTILMQRDELTEVEARELIAEVRDEIQDCIDCGEYFEADEILSVELGLEPDYIFDVLWCKL